MALRQVARRPGWAWLARWQLGRVRKVRTQPSVSDRLRMALSETPWRFAICRFESVPPRKSASTAVQTSSSRLFMRRPAPRSKCAPQIVPGK
jgi:hypothetical protein